MRVGALLVASVLAESLRELATRLEAKALRGQLTAADQNLARQALAGRSASDGCGTGDEDPCTKLKQLSDKEIPQATRDIKKKFEEAAKGAEDQTKDYLDGVLDRSKDVEKQLNKDKSTASKFFEKSNKNMQKLKAEVLQEVGNAKKKTMDLEGAVEEAEEETTSAENAIVGDMEGDKQSFSDNLKDSESELEDEIAEGGESANEGFEEVAEESTEGSQELNAAIKDDSNEFKDHTKSEREEQKGLMKDMNSQAKALKTTEKKKDKEIGRIEQETGKAVTAIQEGKKAAEEAERQETAKTVSETEKEIAMVESDSKSEVGDMKKGNTERDKTLQKDVDTVEGDFHVGMAEMDNEANEELKADLKGVEEGSNEILTAEDEAEKLEEVHGRDKAKNVEAIQKEETELNRDLSVANGAIHSDENGMMTGIAGNLDKERANLGTFMEQQEQSVRSATSAAVHGVENTVEQAAHSVQQASADIEASASEMQENLNANSVMVQKAINGVEGTKEAIGVEQGKVGQAIKESEAKTEEDLAGEEGLVQAEVDKENAQVSQTSDHAAMRANDELKAMIAEANKAIEQFSVHAKEKLSSASSGLKSAETTAAEDVAATEHEAGVIQEKSAAVNQQIGPVEDQVAKSFQAAEDEVNAVDKQTLEVKQNEVAKIQAQASETNEKFAANMHEEEESIRKTQEENAAKTERETADIQTGVSDLKAESDQQERQTATHLANLRSQLLAIQSKAKSVASASDNHKQEVDNAISRALGMISDAQRDDQRKSKELLQELVKNIQGEIDQAAEKSSEDVEKETKQSQDQLNAFVSTAETGVDKDAQDFKEYSQKSRSELEDLEQQVDNQGMELQKSELSLAQKKADLEAAAKAMERQRESLAGRAKEQAENEKELLAQKHDQMKHFMASKLSTAEAEEVASMQQMKKEAFAFFDRAESGVKAEKGKLSNLVEQHDIKINGVVQRIDGEVSKSQRELDSFNQQAGQAQTELAGEVSEVQKDMEMNKDAVKQAEQAEDTKVADTMGQELNGLGGLVNDLQAVQKGTEGEVHHMEDDFKDQLEYFQKQGTAQAHALQGQLDSVNNNAIDLVGEFGQDTAESKRALDASEQRLNACIESTNAQMADFGERLGKLRDSRQDEAIKLHHEVTSMKGEQTEKLTTVVDNLSAMKGATDGADRKLAADQKQFDRLFKEASGMTSNHDSDMIMNMTKTAMELETGHNRLMTWKKKFKHYTIAWRSEVERKLQQLTGSIGNDEDSIAAGRLKQELGVQAGMRSVQDAVQGQIVNAVGQETQQVGGLVNSIHRDMERVFNRKHRDEAQKEADLNAARGELGAAKAESEKEVSELNEGSALVAQKAAQFKTAVANAGEEINGQIALDGLSANDENRKYEDQMQSLTSRLAQLDRATSVLEIGSREQLEQHQSRVAQIEIQALQALTKKLREANQHLKEQDATLSSRVGTIKKQLVAAGWHPSDFK
jgi:hypothetical protein